MIWIHIRNIMEKKKDKLSDFLKEHEAGLMKPSHVSYNGGKFLIPLAENNQFLELFNNHLHENDPLSIRPKKTYFSECISRGKLFNFIMDVEFKQEFRPDVSDDDIQKDIMPRTLECMVGLLKMNNLDIEYMVTARSKYLYHVYFHETKVNIKTAKILLFNCKKLMEKEYPIINWDKSLDSAIYNGGKGLRMIGCFAMNKEEKEGEYPIYRPVNENYEYQDIDLSVLQKSIIRTDIPDPALEEYVIDTEIIDNDLVTEIDVNEQEIRMFISDISKTKEFKNNSLEVVNIKKIHNSYANGFPYYFCIEIKDKFCPFKNGAHRRSSNPLYMILSSDGAFLRCHDEDCHGNIPENKIKLPSAVKKKYFKEEDKIPKEILPDPIHNVPEDLILTDELSDAVQDCLTGGHFNYAKLAYSLYGHRFRVDDHSNGKKGWYEFKKHRFYKNSNNLGLLLSDDMVNYFVLYKRAIGGNKNEFVDMAIKNLKTLTFKNNVLAECANVFYSKHPDFLKKMDSNIHLICFKNGVLDTKKMIFRDGHIDDCITLSTDNEFIEYDENNSEIKEVIGFFEKVFTSPSLRDYVIKKIAQSLSGKNSEHFVIWTGNGSNGKSILCNLIKIGFGEYWNEAPVTLITKVRSGSSSASPEIMDLKGRRITTINEPETNEKLNMGLIKNLTGGDTISARQLRTEQEKFKLQTSIILCCNQIPYIHCSDGGTWRRVKIIEFSSKFKDQGEELTNDKMFYKDLDLDEKITNWGSAFMAVLFEYFKRIKTEGIHEPAEVSAYTKEFRNESDTFAHFLHECVEQSEEFTPFNEFYIEFESWAANNNIKPKLFTKVEMKKMLSDGFRRKIEGSNILFGLKLIDNSDDGSVF